MTRRGCLRAFTVALLAGVTGGLAARAAAISRAGARRLFPGRVRPINWTEARRPARWLG